MRYAIGHKCVGKQSLNYSITWKITINLLHLFHKYFAANAAAAAFKRSMQRFRTLNTFGYIDALTASNLNSFVWLLFICIMLTFFFSFGRNKNICTKIKMVSKNGHKSYGGFFLNIVKLQRSPPSYWNNHSIAGSFGRTVWISEIIQWKNVTQTSLFGRNVYSVYYRSVGRDFWSKYIAK